MRIGIVAGEASGDLLGAGLMRAIQRRYPDAMFEGIGGPAMMEAGCRSLYPMERLSVMGLFEVLSRLPELLLQRRRLARHFLSDPPEVFIGVDAPDYNLALERRLRAAGIPCVHYVSPSVWAWRGYRLPRIARSVDLMLTLFPFEAEFYAAHRVPVRFVGHPLADRIPLTPDAAGARARLGLPPGAEVVALLPGSRGGEVRMLAPVLLRSAHWLLARRPGLRFLVPLVNARTRALFEIALAREPALPLDLVDGQGRTVMAAADAVLMASGTAALEALLLKRPMVITYRLNRLTAWLVRRLSHTRYWSLPNLLAGDALVPELVQEDAVPEKLGAAVLSWLESSAARARLERAALDIHGRLRRDASARAAEAVLELIGHRPP